MIYELLANRKSVGCNDGEEVAKNGTMVCFENG